MIPTGSWSLSSVTRTMSSSIGTLRQPRSLTTTQLMGRKLQQQLLSLVNWTAARWTFYGRQKRTPTALHRSLFGRSRCGVVVKAFQRADRHHAFLSGEPQAGVFHRAERFTRPGQVGGLRGQWSWTGQSRRATRHRVGRLYIWEPWPVQGED